MKFNDLKQSQAEPYVWSLLKIGKTRLVSEMSKFLDKKNYFIKLEGVESLKKANKIVEGGGRGVEIWMKKYRTTPRKMGGDLKLHPFSYNNLNPP